MTLTVRWTIECEQSPEDERLRRFVCEGRWTVRGPNWTGGGIARAVLDLLEPPHGTQELTFNGNLNAT